ncbi:sulfotransferase domain-containing protein [Phenylobacterium sp.]|jgi:hypothetical protein|uniref:sulfotransferase domain-containing protein n=1 Tax=Phenylobacterium sp. TaxID=1871053 RepID=UPI002F93C451
MAAAPLVSFLIAGVQKGGTTALHAYLGQQGGVALAEPKEVHFFDDETQDWAHPDYAAYHAHFPAEAEGPRGEATPIYAYWPGSLERIARYNAAMRIVLLLRDPVERAWSHWRMEYARGAETDPFSWCIREGRRRLFDAEPWGHHREFSYVERGFYAEQVERLFALFAKEQVLILTSEALRDAPGPELAKVRAFIGAAEAPAPEPQSIHVGRDVGADLAPEDAHYLRTLYARDLARLRELTGVGFD